MLKDRILILILLYTIIGLFAIIPFNQTIFNPISTALTDFDINDIIYSKLRNELPPDTNIVIVNLSNADRQKIAGAIRKINEHNPKVIGIDVIFATERDPLKDSILAYELSGIKNLVLVNRLLNYDNNTDSYQSVSGTCDKFSRNARVGYANFSYENNSFRTARVFKPMAECNNKIYYSFAVKIVEQYNKASLKLLLKRGNDVENINFRGNLTKFYFTDLDELEDPSFNPGFIRNKIVLLGYTGIDRNTNTLEDIFFTPLNERYAGKTFPDMYGVVIHANIISMILSNDYINRIPVWIILILSIFIAFLNISFFQAVKKKYRDWFGTFTKLAILFQTIVIILTGIMLFNYAQLKVNTTLLLASIVLVPVSADIYTTYFQKFLNRKNRKEEAHE